VDIVQRPEVIEGKDRRYVEIGQNNGESIHPPLSKSIMMDYGIMLDYQEWA
jgi:hypothetical protein